MSAATPYSQLSQDPSTQYPPTQAHSSREASLTLDEDPAAVALPRTKLRLVLFTTSIVLIFLAILRADLMSPFGFLRKGHAHGGEAQQPMQPPPPPHHQNQNQSMGGGGGAGGGRSVGYFVNWGIYDRKYLPQQLPVEHLTHILYAFANVRPETGEVYLTDAWADEQIHFDGDSWNDQGNNLYGCFKQLNLLKQKNRHLRVLLSIGGWTYSSNFANLVNPSHRATFASSAVQLLESFGLDGIDVDWEYPKDANEAGAYTDLLRVTREKLDEAERKVPGSTLELTVAAPCGIDKIDILQLREMDRYLSFWNLMAYDFAGTWSPLTAHQASLYPDPSSPSTPSVHSAIQSYLSSQIHPSKLVLGLPLYGRSFAASSSPSTNSPYNGAGGGTWEKGMYDYRALPRPNAVIGEDLVIGAGWSWTDEGGGKGEWVSFDTPNVTAMKGRYVRENGLGGVMFWEMDADLRPEDALRDHALVPIAVGEMGGINKSLSNRLEYRESKWDNLREGRL